MKIKIGDWVKDTISDFEGIIVARAVYMNGCVRCQVQAKIKEDGTLMDGEWIDETQLICKLKAEKKHREKDNGGPCDIPSNINPS